MKKSILIQTFAIILFITTVAYTQEKEIGYFNRFRIGFLPGIQNQNESAFKQRGTLISTINGWKFNAHLGAGLGVGISSYVNPTITMIPIYANIDYYFLKKRSTPYIYGNVGYSFATTNAINGGLLTDVGLGWKFSAGKKINLGPEFGYRYQEYKHDFNTSVKERLKSIFVGFNIMF